MCIILEQEHGMGRTNVVLDEALVKKAMKATDAKTKREVIHLGLQALIRQKKQRSIMALRGSGMIDPEYAKLMSNNPARE
jgi:Arc/MetJ family transcription regulator